MSPEAQLFWAGLIAILVLLSFAIDLCLHFVRDQKIRRRISVSANVVISLVILSVVGAVSNWNAAALLIAGAILFAFGWLKRHDVAIRKRLEEIGKTKLW